MSRLPRQIVPETIVRATQQTLDAAFEVHTEVGPGCFERVYEICLAKVLQDRGFQVERQRKFNLSFRGETIPIAYRADLLVEDAIVVEIKSIPNLLPVHFSQVRTYLNIATKPVGLLLNFGAEHLRDGYERISHPKYAFLPPSRARLIASGDSGTSGAAPQADDR